MAERLCGATHRFDQAGSPRPCRCTRRAPPSAVTSIVHDLSQRGAYASVAEQGRAGFAQGSSGEGRGPLGVRDGPSSPGGVEGVDVILYDLPKSFDSIEGEGEMSTSSTSWIQSLPIDLELPV